MRLMQPGKVSLYALPSLYQQKVKLRLSKKGTLPMEIITTIGKHYCFSHKELRSKSRISDLVFARQLIMSVLLRKTGMTLRSVGLEFNRDHSTVMNAVKTIQDYLDTGYRADEIDYFFRREY